MTVEIAVDCNCCPSPIDCKESAMCWNAYARLTVFAVQKTKPGCWHNDQTREIKPGIFQTACVNCGAIRMPT